MEWRVEKLSNLEQGDIEEIFKIRTKVFVEEQHCSCPDRDYKDDDAYHVFLKNYVSGEIIAYLRILERGVAYSEVSIGRLVVNPTYRRRGYAREALHQAFNFIKYNMDEHAIRISAQQHLVGFYEKEGFVKMSNIYFEENIPHVEMLKERL